MKAISSGRPGLNKKTGGVFATKVYQQFRDEIEHAMTRDIGNDEIESMMKEIKKATGFKVYIKCGDKVANEEYWGVPKIVHPDVDNLMKPILDQVLGRLGINDAQIFSGTLEKEYAKNDYIHIVIDLYDVPKYKNNNAVPTRQKRKQKLSRMTERLKSLESE